MIQMEVECNVPGMEDKETRVPGEYLTVSSSYDDEGLVSIKLGEQSITVDADLLCQAVRNATTTKAWRPIPRYNR